MTLSRRILLVAASMTVVACSDASAPKPPPSFALNPAEQGVATSGNDFSFALFQQVAKADPRNNVFISPLSASMSLGMAMNGASGSTFDAMRTALRLGSGDVGQLDAGYQGLIGLLRGLDPTTTFQIANSVWTRNTFAFKQPFLDTTEKYFDAQAQGLNFDDVPGSLATINGWVSSHTGGKIPTILDDITPDEVMFLINAIYFKGSWRSKFDPAATIDAPFHATGGDQGARLMHREAKMSYTETSAFQAVDLPYGDSAFR